MDIDNDPGIPLVGATLFYGARPSPITDSLLPKFRTFDPKDQRLADLSRELARITGNVLAPVEYYRRMKVVRIKPIDIGDGKLVGIDGWTVHGDGFSLTWGFKAGENTDAS